MFDWLPPALILMAGSALIGLVVDNSALPWF